MDILAEATATIKQRQHGYGPPAMGWASVSKAARALGIKPDSNARDAALFMVLVKLAREVQKHKQDNLVDAAAYLQIAQDCQDAGSGG